MWVKLTSDVYLNVDTGREMLVKKARNRDEWRIVVTDTSGTGDRAAIKAGYASRENAQDALDIMMQDSTAFVPDPDPTFQE